MTNAVRFNVWPKGMHPTFAGKAATILLPMKVIHHMNGLMGVDCPEKRNPLPDTRSVWPAVVKQFVEVASDYFISAIARHLQ